MSERSLTEYPFVNDDTTPLLRQNSRDPDKKGEWSLILTCFAVYFAPLCAGFSLGYSGCTIAYLKESILNDDEASWFASIINIGAAAGGILGGLLADKIGRKTTLLLLPLPLLLGFLLFALPSPIPSAMISGRFLNGVGTGMVCICVPTYISEVSSTNLRGSLGTGFQVSLSLGVFLAFMIGMITTYKWLAIIAASLCLVSIVTCLFIPESPIWLISRNKYSEAFKSLILLRNDIADAEDELNRLKAHGTFESSSMNENSSIFRKSILQPVCISLILMIAQQCGGINVVLFFCSDIFKTAGYSKYPDRATAVIGALQLVFSIVVSMVIEKAGRKVLMIISFSGLTLSCASMGTYYYLKENNISNLSALSLGSLICYIITFSVGAGPIPWLMMSELIPNSVKGKASALATFTNWMTSFIVTKIRINMVNGVHDYGTFWTYGIINLLSVIFVVFCVPETKGKSLEEIELIFSDTKERSGSEYARI